MKSELTNSILYDQARVSASLLIEDQVISHQSNKRLAKASSFKAFFTLKASIILFSIIATVLLATIMITFRSDSKSNEITKTSLKSNSEESTDLEEIIMASDSGDKEVVEYLENRTTKDEMIDKIKKETRHYAKRQLTWFRKNKETTWLDGEKSPEDNVKEILKGL